MKVLDLGCGKRKAPGAIGIDFREGTDADVIHDLNLFPWPFKDNEFDRIIASQVLEHMKDFFKAMEEIHRITRNRGTVEVITPHYTDSSSFRDPSHYWHLTSQSFLLLDPSFSTSYFTTAKFKVRKLRIVTLKLWRYLGIEFLINSFNLWYPLRFFRKFWEDYLCFIIRGKVIHAELEVIK